MFRKGNRILWCGLTGTVMHRLPEIELKDKSSFGKRLVVLLDEPVKFKYPKQYIWENWEKQIIVAESWCRKI
jgi:hypothetical protein